MSNFSPEWTERSKVFSDAEVSLVEDWEEEATVTVSLLLFCPSGPGSSAQVPPRMITKVEGDYNTKRVLLLQVETWCIR
jgi:hypothetical protein